MLSLIPFRNPRSSPKPKSRMIVTFDTTILVRATKRSRGPAREVLNAIALDPDHTIALSPYIVGEVGRVLSYSRMQALYRLTPDEIYEHVEFLHVHSLMSLPSP